MKHYLLDTSALLTLRDDEPGADHVAELLALAGKNKVRCLGCFMTLMEVFYRVWKDEGEAAGLLGGFISQGIGNITVGNLVKDNRHNQNGNRK